MRKFNVFNLIFVLAVALSFFLVLNSDSRAQSACDGESGAAYGLCNAYCEAMDCDGAPQASQNACDKVASKYTNIAGLTMPCEAVSECQSSNDCPGTEDCLMDAGTGIGTCVCRTGPGTCT